jgi:uncharacterized protein
MAEATKSERFEMRLDLNMIGRIDEWRSKQDGFPSRAEAIRHLANLGLERSGQPIFSDGEKMITLMLCDLLKSLNTEVGIEPDLVEEAIHGGHYWALPYQYPGIYHNHVDQNSTVKEALDILSLWDAIEFSYGRLSPDDKERIRKEAEPFGDDVKFLGFDGNHESEHLGVASFFVHKMGRFGIFNDGRSFNSHMPTLDSYRRMLSIFNPLKGKMFGTHLNADTIVQILKEWVHPDIRK